MDVCTQSRSSEWFKVDLKIVLPVEILMDPPTDLSEDTPGRLVASSPKNLVVKSPVKFPVVVIGAYLLGVLMGVLIIL